MTGPKYRLSDAEAKAVLLKWPTRTTLLWPPPGGKGAWIRSQPSGGTAAGPRIYAPGSDLFATQPDGMWVHFNGITSCDVVAIEVCGSIQNLNDKRSRYMPSTHSLVLRVTASWADEVVAGGQGRASLSRRDLAGTLGTFATPTVDVPIRVLRVLYALKNVDYKAWVPQHVPTGYEYFMPHSSLATYTRPETQSFLKGMSVASQFHTLPSNVRVPKVMP